MAEILNTLDPRYPYNLSKILPLPETIYYKGLLTDSTFSATLGVVGSRKMTNYAKYIIRSFVSYIARSGITIVSGFMYGVDSYAHQVTLDVNGVTVAVMPCGIDLICPRGQNDLYSNILSHGLVLSEFPIATQPKVWTFPKRNRIIAGICDALFVVEAATKSGSLITADFSISYERPVFVVPGNINGANYAGICELIAKGAIVVTDPKDIVGYYSTHLETAPPKEHATLNKQQKGKIDIGDTTETNSLTQDNLQTRLYEELKIQPCTTDELAKNTQLDLFVVQKSLMKMTLNKLVYQKGGYFFAC